MEQFVLDANAIINVKRVEGKELYSTAEVAEEIKDSESKLLLTSLDVNISEPSSGSVGKVKEAAEKSGDMEKLSRADISVLALALDLGATLLSDDYDLQNVAHSLGVKVKPVLFEKIKEIREYSKICPGCRKKYPPGSDECDVCGTELKRIWKSK